MSSAPAFHFSDLNLAAPNSTLRTEIRRTTPVWQKRGQRSLALDLRGYLAAKNRRRFPFLIKFGKRQRFLLGSVQVGNFGLWLPRLRQAASRCAPYPNAPSNIKIVPAINLWVVQSSRRFSKNFTKFLNVQISVSGVKSSSNWNTEL